MNFNFIPRKNRRRLEHERRRARYNQRRPDLKSGGMRWSLRSLKSVFKVAAVLAAVGAFIVGGKLLGDRLLFDNPHYQIRERVVESDGHIPRSEIIEIAGIGDTSNLLLVPIGQIDRRLESLPAVASASVTRSFPGKLTIRVAEREPIAWLQCEIAGIFAHRSNGGVLLDAQGIAFSPHNLHEQMMALPVIEVVDLPPVIAGSKVTTPVILQMLRLIDLSNELFFDQRIPIKSISAESSYALKVRYISGSVVIFGREDVADNDPLLRQLEDFGAVMAYAKENRRRLGTLDLTVRENRPATFLALNDGGDSKVLSAIPYLEGGESEQKNDLRAILGPLY